jgi:YD repeat-containing protein
VTASARINLVALSLLIFASAPAQQPITPQFGIVPTGSYENYHVDSVNMDNGNDIIHIPLFSLPQLGKLSLSFSIVANTATWQPDISCSPDGLDCFYSYTPVAPIYGSLGYPQQISAIGPTIVSNNLPAVGATQFISPAYCFKLHPPSTSEQCGWFYSEFWSIYDATGGTHPLYYDATNISNLRTTDGSGYLYESGMPDPSQYQTPSSNNPNTNAVIIPAVLIDSHGVKTVQHSNGTYSQSDPDDNTISFTPSSYFGGQYTDTLGRVIPPIPQATSSTSGCPDLGQSFQPAVSSAVWQVPGPNNQAQTYLICYTSFTIRTNFFGWDTQQFNVNYVDSQDYNHWTQYDETYGPTVGMQSIVLPDGEFWGFLYDAADPNNTSDIGHNGALTMLLLPQGGSISYQYGTAQVPSCPYSEYGPLMVTSRTVADNKGHNYIWSYSIQSDYTPPDHSWNSLQPTFSTDPNGNDTVYSEPISNVCGYSNVEKVMTYYQGTYQSGSTLKTVAKTYQNTLAPVPSGDLAIEGDGNTLLNSETTRVGDVSTMTSTGYGSEFFSTIAPACFLYYDPGSDSYPCVPPPSSMPTGTANLTLSIPTSTSMTDYSGAALSSSSTAFQWQGGANYLAANLLDTPTVETTYDGSGSQVAQTTTSYDETPYIANTGVIAGLPTTVSRWNNNGAAVQAHTAWTQYGMVDHTVDGRGYTNLQHTYNYQANGSQFINLYPSAAKNANNQTTLYTWDTNTGNLASVTDPNGVLSSYSYDSMGRTTKVENAVGTPEESWTTYSYPNPTTVDAFQDKNTKDDMALEWATTADGLGRVVEQVTPSGSRTDTSYDGLDQVTSVSNPYFSASDPTYGFTGFAYDALGRKTYQCQPDNGTGAGTCAAGSSYLQWTYSGNVTTSYDELRHSAQQKSDALGRLTNVTEPTGFQTSYTYDALGNLLGVHQAGNGSTDTPRVRSFTYDSLSRLLCASSPENSAATCPTSVATGLPSSGATLYFYDANGNVFTKTDSRLVTTHYSYDSLDRLLSKTYTNDPSGTLSSCYLYDSASNGIGRLGIEWTTGSSCSSTAGYQSLRSYLSYDPLGRVWNEQQCVLGKCTTGPAPPCAGTGNAAPYYQTYCYDLAAEGLWSVNGVTNVPGEGPISFGQTFDAVGRLSTLTSSWADSTHPSPLFSVNPSNGYMPTGSLQNFGVGNHMLVNRTYDSRLRTTEEVVTHQ